jgi:hypothetical protein
MSFQFTVLNDFNVYFNIGKKYIKTEATLRPSLSVQLVPLRKFISAVPDFASSHWVLRHVILQNPGES